MDTYKHSIRGRQSRANGEYFEGMITLFLAPAVFATIVRTICTVQTKWREKQRYFAMFARNVDTMMGT